MDMNRRDFTKFLGLIAFAPIALFTKRAMKTTDDLKVEAGLPPMLIDKWEPRESKKPWLLPAKPDGDVRLEHEPDSLYNELDLPIRDIHQHLLGRSPSYRRMHSDDNSDILPSHNLADDPLLGEQVFTEFRQRLLSWSIVDDEHWNHPVYGVKATDEYV